MKKNIGIFTHDFYPIVWWIWSYTHSLYNEFQNVDDCNVYFFSPCENNLENHVQICEWYWYSNSKTKNIWFSFALNFVIEDLIDKYKLDIVHIQAWAWAILLFKRLSVPVIYTCHHTYHQQYTLMKSQKWKRLFYQLEKKSVQFANKIICDTNDTKDNLINYYSRSVSDENIAVIPIWINLAEYAWHRMDPNKKEKKSICYVWRMDDRKWILRLVDCIPYIIKNDPDIKFYLMWKWPLYSKIEKIIREEWLTRNVTLMWFVTEEVKRSRISRSVIQIVPSIFEWFWIAALEWLALWTKIIASDVQWFDRIKEHSLWSLVTYWSTPDELYQEVIRNLSKPYTTQDLTKFDRSNIMQEVKAIYHKL